MNPIPLVAGAKMTELNIVILKNCSIFEQLQYEEALLRTNKQNWCLINSGSPPAIVMGISGKSHELIEQDVYLQNPIPVIRRFSGGGCVFIEETTFFITLILQRSFIDLGHSPKLILEWTETLLKPVFSPADFQLKENDYVIGSKKIGGNAQYLAKNCYLHHTSFLWDYSSDQMMVLKMPPKTPHYRDGRDHEAFLDRLKNHFSSLDILIDKLLCELDQRFICQRRKEEELKEFIQFPHRKSTELLKHIFT